MRTHALSRLCLVGVLAAAVPACKKAEKPSLTLKELAPAPLPGVAAPAPSDSGTDDRDAAYRVRAAPVFGAGLPPTAQRITISDGHVWLGAADWNPGAPDAAAALAQFLGSRPALLSPDADTYVLQAAALFAALDDAHVPTWLLHPSGQVAYPLILRDEPAFGAWVQEAKEGRIRIVQREDGLELSTTIGKLLGPDPSGPSVPVRGGQLDVAAERAGLSRLKERFTHADELCVLPSFGTELNKVATVMSGTYRAAGEPFFDKLCLVYSRAQTQLPVKMPSPGAKP